MASSRPSKMQFVESLTTAWLWSNRPLLVVKVVEPIKRSKSDCAVGATNSELDISLRVLASVLFEIAVATQEKRPQLEAENSTGVQNRRGTKP